MTLKLNVYWIRVLHFIFCTTKRPCSSFQQTCNLQSFDLQHEIVSPLAHFGTFLLIKTKKTNFVNPLIALSRIYREPSSVKHVTVSKSEAVRRLIDHDRLKRLEWLLSAKSEIQTVISEYYCDFTNSKTSWNIFEFLCVWCNTWPVLSLSVSVPRSPDWRERVGWRETAQTLGHQEGREDVKNSSIIFLFYDSSAKFYFIALILFFLHQFFRHDITSFLVYSCA